MLRLLIDNRKVAGSGAGAPKNYQTILFGPYAKQYFDSGRALLKERSCRRKPFRWSSLCAKNDLTVQEGVPIKKPDGLKHD